MAEGRRYLFTGGGTGGHVTPNLAILGKVRSTAPDASFRYVGSAHGYENRAAQESGVPFHAVPCARFRSPRQPVQFMKMALRIFCGVLLSMGIILRFRPHVVIASGGFVSVPCVIAAWILRRPIYVHEQNVHPGMANRVLAQLATRVGVTFRESLDAFPSDKTVVAGYPVRSQIGEGCPERARERFQLSEQCKVAFVVGGSMGSRAINRGTVEALKTLLRDENIAVVHSTGLSNTGEYQAFEDTRERLENAGLSTVVPGRYFCKPFFKNIQDIYAVADLVVARAGAGTIMELATVGKPSILIPKSDVPGDHQLMNAISVQRSGSAEVLFEERGDEGGRSVVRVRGDGLAKKISDLMSDDSGRAKMGRCASRLAVDDALTKHRDIVHKLATEKSRVEQVTEIDRCGVLLDEQGQTHELLFRNNIVGTGMLPDIRVQQPRCRGSARAVILRTRQSGGPEFHILRRSGPVELAGKPVEGRVTLKAEDVISVGGRRFTFLLKDREVERPAQTGGISLRVAIMALGTLTSRLFGFAREAVMGATFGLGNTLDLMSIGLQVSSYFRGVFAEQAVDAAFMPTFVHLQRTGRTDKANRLFSSVLTLTLIGSGAVTVAGILTLPMWLPHIAPGFVARGIIDDAVMLTQIMFPYLVLVSVAAVLAAVLKSCNRFAVPSFSSILFSVGVLIGVALYPVLGLPALGIGVLLGGFGQVLAMIPPLLSHDVSRGFGVRLRPVVDLKDPGVRKVGRVTPNILADVSVQRAGSMVDTVLATSLAAGMVSALHFAMVIFMLPFGLISVSINTVILKELSEGQALKDRNDTRRLLAGGINWTVFALLPVSVVMLVLADPIVNLLFRWVNFDAVASAHVALALRCYAVGLTAWGLTGLCGRFFSARMEQSKSTLTSFIALAANISISVTLVNMGMGIAGLALGTTAALVLCAAMRLTMLCRSLRAEGIALKTSHVLPSVGHTTLATAGALIAMLVAYSAVKDFHALPLALNRLFVLGVPLAFALFAFCAAGLLLRSEQVEELLIRVNRRGRDNAAKGTEPRPVNPYCMDPPQRLLSWVKNHPDVAQHCNFARRIASFLGDDDWRVRYVGVKLAGTLDLKSFRYDLAELATSRKPASRWQRLLGGDFEEPGFIRRNAIISLRQLGEVDERIERCLLMAVGDPYFEVRMEAAATLGGFAASLSGPAREEALVRLTAARNDKSFEVAVAAVEALGKLALDEGVVDALKTLHFHRNWKVRNAVILAYGTLVSRRVLTNRGRILALLDDIPTTSEGFTPRFVLKENWQALQWRLLNKEEDPSR